MFLYKVAVALTITSDPWVTHGSDTTVTCSDLTLGNAYLQFRRSSTSVVDHTSLIIEYNHQNNAVLYGKDVNDTQHYEFQESSNRYHMIIKSVTLDDGGKYWCYIFELPPISPSVTDTSVIQIRGRFTHIVARRAVVQPVLGGGPMETVYRRT